MADAWRIEVDDRDILRELEKLTRRAEDLSPAMREIGELGVATTKRRFALGMAPDGTRWAPNSQVTILQYLDRYSGSYRKDGRLSKAGAGLVMGKKPLIGESKTLSTAIQYRLVDTTSVEWGSDRPQAAMMQYGGRKAQFPHLWGDIPGRPYLGLSDEDAGNILDILGDHLAR